MADSLLAMHGIVNKPSGKARRHGKMTIVCSAAVPRTQFPLTYSIISLAVEQSQAGLPHRSCRDTAPPGVARLRLCRDIVHSNHIRFHYAER